jgi:hypothetical protein
VYREASKGCDATYLDFKADYDSFRHPVLAASLVLAAVSFWRFAVLYRSGTRNQVCSAF